MYIWKIDQLKKDLKDLSLTEKEQFKYLLVNIILYAVIMIPMLGITISIMDVYMGILEVIITIIGTFYIYKVNGGDKGQDILQRFLSIGFVAGIRWIVFICIPAVIFYFVLLTTLSIDFSEVLTLKELVFFSFLGVSYYWYFGKHIKDLIKK